MAWTLRAAMGLVLALGASVAMAECPGRCGDPYADGGRADYYDDYDGGYYEAPPSPDELSPSFGYARQHYAWTCGCAAERARYESSYSEAYESGGEVNLSGGIFAGMGGVGPIPSDDYIYGGGYWMGPRPRPFPRPRAGRLPGGHWPR